MDESVRNVMFSSEKECWATPMELFEELDREFQFTLDPCAIEENAKCSKYYTPDIDGLKQSWEGETVFCNPPYGKSLYNWVRKCAIEGSRDNTIVVLLVPARTDTKWFHEYVWKKAEIRFIKGRLKFGGSLNSAPFPSMICIFN